MLNVIVPLTIIVFTMILTSRMPPPTLLEWRVRHWNDKSAKWQLEAMTVMALIAVLSLMWLVGFLAYAGARALLW